MLILEAAKRPVDAFVTFYLDNAASLAGEVDMLECSSKVTDRVKSRYKNRQTEMVLI